MRFKTWEIIHILSTNMILCLVFKAMQMCVRNCLELVNVPLNRSLSLVAFYKELLPFNIVIQSSWKGKLGFDDNLQLVNTSTNLIFCCLNTVFPKACTKFQELFIKGSLNTADIIFCCWLEKIVQSQC